MLTTVDNPSYSVKALATFDGDGLFQRQESSQSLPPQEINAWIQGIFQSLGLRLLISTSFQLGGFQTVVIKSNLGTTVVVRCRSSYRAVLFDHQVNAPEEQLVKWIRERENWGNNEGSSGLAMYN